MVYNKRRAFIEQNIADAYNLKDKKKTEKEALRRRPPVVEKHGAVRRGEEVVVVSHSTHELHTWGKC